MSSNAQKTPLARTLQTVVTRRANDLMQLEGKEFPCSIVSVMGSLVKVKFEIQSAYTLPQVLLPVAYSRYVRLPLKQGDMGIALSADAYLGGVSGLGGGTANLTQRGNLSNLVFMPISNRNFVASPDPNAVFVTAPNGAIITEDTNNASIKVTPTSIILKVGATTITIDASGIHVVGNMDVNGGLTAAGGAGNEFTVTGNMQLNGMLISTGQITTPDIIFGVGSIPLSTHVHLAPGGGGDTGPPLP